MTSGDAEAAGQVVQQMWQGLPQEMSQEMPEGSPAGISLGAGQTRRDHQRRCLPASDAYSASPTSPGADPDEEAAGAGDGCAGRGGRAVRSRGQRRQRPLQVLDMGAPFVQARQEMTGLGLGKLAGTSFVGERQGALMAQPFQLGPQSRRRLVGSRSQGWRSVPGCRRPSSHQGERGR
ncbi:hypothetical protein ACFW4Q_34180 [Streptomyces rochei]|uniref:hypothetical protein n=1 Tax=Streptomyces rochei TaxID=1928 RepID=UPI00368C8119